MLYHTYEGHDINDELKYLLRKGEQEIMNSQLMNTYVQSGCRIKINSSTENTHTHTDSSKYPSPPSLLHPCDFFHSHFKNRPQIQRKGKKRAEGRGEKNGKRQKKDKNVHRSHC